ncbi:glycosyltransferase family 2 protein [Pseudomonas parasichuanensis]|uniref:glycosyltransferase family 2 protein n=1 Tax=Pseudomonas parasichuanensis TaxID=2892329 RepID=UPI001F3BD3EC|nr:glycosyltransferase family 2 protein [Pseudomonas parasichuanensis]
MMAGNRSLGARVRTLLGIKLGVLQQGNVHYQLVDQVLQAKVPDSLPLISIVTPSYNQGGFIGETIRSVLSQGYSNLEYIVQDNESTDGTLDVLTAELSSCFRFYVESDQGQADAINRGFSRSRGEIMAFLNSDDVLLPGTLAYVAQIFQEYPEVDAIYGNRVLIDAESNIVGRWVLPGHDGELLRHVDYIPQETLFWRRELWTRVGGRLDAGLAFALDWDLLLKFMTCGAHFFHAPHFLGGFRVHEEQKTSSEYIKNGVDEMRVLRRKYAPSRIAKILMPIRHLIFLIKHVRADSRLSATLKILRK